MDDSQITHFKVTSEAFKPAEKKEDRTPERYLPALREVWGVTSNPTLGKPESFFNHNGVFVMPELE